MNNERFTKHYYAGTQRIASKVGSGEFYNVYGVNGFHLTAGQMDYEQRLEQMEEGIQAYYLQNGIPPGVPIQKGSNADPYITGVALPNVPLGNYSVPTKPFVKLPLNASLGLSSAVGDDWTVYSFERSISIGGSFGNSTFSVSGTTGFGSCKIIQDIGPKTDGQKIVSWLPWIAIELSKPY